MMLTGLGWLARADLASAPAAVQAQCLRGLERAAPSTPPPGPGPSPRSPPAAATSSTGRAPPGPG